MGRVINPESAGKDRSQLTRSIVLALRELMRQAQPNAHSQDLAAYIALALEEISATVDTSVVAWEKKGYWLKADRFRLDWEWAERASRTLSRALSLDDWATVALTAAQVAQKLMSVDVPQRHRLGTPWVGAWQRLERGVKNEKRQFAARRTAFLWSVVYFFFRMMRASTTLNPLPSS